MGGLGVGGVCVFGGGYPRLLSFVSDGVPQYAVLVAVANDPERAKANSSLLVPPHLQLRVGWLLHLARPDRVSRGAVTQSLAMPAGDTYG